MKKRVALITHETSLVGGLPTLTSFLHRTLVESGRYEPELISLATSAADATSVQLKSPTTWLQPPQIESVAWRNLTFTHVGAWASELEFQRYRPRRGLTELLQRYDLLQFVVGSSPWVRVAKNVDRPILVWTATTTRADRASQMRNGSIARRAWSSWMVSIAERYESRALKAAAAVFALSEYTRAAIEPIVGAGKVLLAPCGVDTALFRPTARPPGNYILWVGRLSDPRKNVRLALEAYVMLRKAMEDVPDLYLVGDYLTKPDVAFLRSHQLEDKVRLIERRGLEDLAKLYRNAQFLVLSSNEEGLGIVILEAMASGLPVISTSSGGPVTAITEGRTGLLTPVGDVGALADAMAKLLRNPLLRKQMGAEGRNVAEQRFSLAAAGKIFLDTYDQVLNSEFQSASIVNNSLPGMPAALPE
ncbi:MAG: glycosyltransferase family 4 protein [Pyrinomonadaceae bacterium]|nr:glycosyltransferase family 4 protein [Pyrinomonadaceae bacterium]